ncbi:MAG: GTPase HflX [Alphaproteobacteria bacterium]|nr:MAG: GTPase HflX [Alphaproteobacteria bacterium]
MIKGIDSDQIKLVKKEITLDRGPSPDDGPDNGPVDGDAPLGQVSGTKVLVLHPCHKTRPSVRLRPPSSQRTPQARLEEAVSLCHALHMNVVQSLIVRLSKLTPATYIGKGKLLEMADIISLKNIELVILDCELTPGQQRNIERLLKVKVIDRTGLILEIFGERAQTKEGVLQVELAHLTYEKSRLVRSWTHLERQRGGFGFLGGPGESQIESDRRQIGERITRIGKQLDDVSRTRALHRSGRKKNQIPVVAMVGYTNAGKSTLFNYLTDADVLAENMLFATLDPTMREINLVPGKKAILSDTVGFISALPIQLVAAFKATLEEVMEADLILHVRDISHPDTEAQKEDVMAVLLSLGLEEGADCPIYEVWSKIDLLDDEQRQVFENLAALKQNVSLLSAVTGEGCDDFRSALNDMLAKGDEILKIAYAHDQGAAMAWMYKHGEVIGREDTERETILKARIDAKLRGRIEKNPTLIGRIVD